MEQCVEVWLISQRPAFNRPEVGHRALGHLGREAPVLVEKRLL